MISQKPQFSYILSYLFLFSLSPPSSSLSLGHRNWVKAVTQLTDGRLVTAGNDKTLRVWLVDPCHAKTPTTTQTQPHTKTQKQTTELQTSTTSTTPHTTKQNNTKPTKMDMKSSLSPLRTHASASIGHSLRTPTTPTTASTAVPVPTTSTTPTTIIPLLPVIRCESVLKGHQGPVLHVTSLMDGRMCR